MDITPESSEIDWEWLPKHILESILHNLVSLSDRAAFGVVCKQWYVVLKHCLKCHHVSNHGIEVPLLLVPTKDRSKKNRSMYKISKQDICSFQLSVPYNRRCCGSSHGWLIFVTDSKTIILYNPFTSARIYLPPISKTTAYKHDGYIYSIRKVILSNDPAIHPNEYVAVAIYGSFDRLAYIKSGDRSWTYVDESHTLFYDVLHFRGRIIAVKYHSLLVWLDTINNHVHAITEDDLGRAHSHYIVETSFGTDLLYIQRFFGENSNKYIRQGITSHFKIYKIIFDDRIERVVKWINMESLGDDAVFLGDNYSLSVRASNFHGCQSDSIYFTDHYISTIPYVPWGPIDMAIFNLKDKSIRSHYMPMTSNKKMPPPIWIVPMLKADMEFEN